MGSFRYRSLIEDRSLTEALNTVNSPPVVSFNFWGFWALGRMGVLC